MTLLETKLAVNYSSPSNIFEKVICDHIDTVEIQFTLVYTDQKAVLQNLSASNKHAGNPSTVD